jgi:hypothetical protein
MVWQKWWVIILPAALWCTVLGKIQSHLSKRFMVNAFSIATGSGLLNILSKGIHGETIEVFSLSRWITPFCSASLVANFVATGLLALRIWQVQRKTSGCSGPVSKTVLYRFGRVLVESGMLYSTSLLIALILYICKSNGQYIMIDCVRHSLSCFLAIDNRRGTYIFFLF